MKYVCINKGNDVYITINKVYESTSWSTDSLLYIINDSNKICAYHYYQFISLDEFRNKKLELIGI